ncbi:hypothetical protein ACLKA7_016228 [Drosophila subpalustris]
MRAILLLALFGFVLLSVASANEEVSQGDQENDNNEAAELDDNDSGSDDGEVEEVEEAEAEEDDGAPQDDGEEIVENPRQD